MNELSSYRNQLQEHRLERQEMDAIVLARVLEPVGAVAQGVRRFSLRGLYDVVLLDGEKAADEVYCRLRPVFDHQCVEPPRNLTPGEISLASLANLFACCGHFDQSDCFRDRLRWVATDRKGHFAYWHFAKAFASIALDVPLVYRPMAGFDPSESIPFSPHALHGFNPQALVAHLAGAIEHHATIDDVWPAFTECVANFPVQEETGEYDEACLFWIARIVHHKIGGQPVGATAGWLHRHFNAWADGAELRPIDAT